MESSILTPKQLQQNFILGVANGMLLRSFNTLTDPSLVLTWLVSQVNER